MNPSTPTPTRTRALTATRRPALPAAVVILLSLFGALALTTLLATFGALPAQAHDQLVSSDPADGDELDEAPAVMTLTFNTEPLDVQPQVVMTDAAGDVVLDGTPAIDGSTATLPIDDGTLTGGAYSVAWRVVSSDGHPIEGTFGFTLAEQAAPAEESTSEEPPASEDSASEDTSETASDADDSGLIATNPAASPETDGAEAGDEADGSATTTIAIVTGAVLLVAVAVVAVIAWRRRGADDTGVPSGTDGTDGTAGTDGDDTPPRPGSSA